MRKADSLDLRLLRQLQGTRQLNLGEAAERAGLSSAAATRRLERMERVGIIDGYEVVLDWRALGYSVEVSLRVTLDKTNNSAFDEFIAAARDIPQVTEIQTFLGRVDVRLEVLARTIPHYRDIYRNRILNLPHIADIEALMLVGELYRSESLPL